MIIYHVRATRPSSRLGWQACTFTNRLAVARVVRRLRNAWWSVAITREEA